MTWAPNIHQPEANYEGVVMDNLLSVIERDFAEAYDYYYPEDEPEDFKERALGQVVENIFPCLAIGPKENATRDADDGSHMEEAIRLEVFIGVTAPSAALVTRKACKYVKVFNSVIRSARPDLVEGLSNVFGVILEIEHTYDSIRERQSIYYRGVGVEVTIFLRER